MKNMTFFSAGILLLSLIAVIYSNSSLYAENDIIRLGYSDVEAFPYQIRDDSNPPGIAFEIISEAAKQIGIKIIYVRLPNKRIQHSLREGNIIDGAFMFSYDRKRTANGVYPNINGKPDSTRKIATLSYYIYKKKGSSIDWDGDNFSGIDTTDPRDSIGANSGYSVIKDLAGKGVSVDDGAKKTEQNFLKLQTGRIAGFAHQDLVADNYILSAKITGIEKLPKPFIQKDYFLMFSNQFYKKNQQTSEKLWNKIGKIRDNKSAEVTYKYKE